MEFRRVLFRSEVGAVQFIEDDVSMDNVRDTTKASLFVWEDNQIQAVHRGLLTEVNQEAKTYDRVIAEQIESGDIHGLILMSIDPDGANKQAIEAATKMEIPIVGTGGTAMANVGSKGANVIATSGTTGTTNRTRAISFVTSLARHWDIKYRPTFSESSGDDDGEEGSIFKNISIRGIMVSSLPAFISKIGRAHV